MYHVSDNKRAAKGGGGVGRSEQIGWRVLRGWTQPASKTRLGSVSIMLLSGKRDLLPSKSLFLKILTVRKRKVAQRERSPTNTNYLEREIYGKFYYLYEKLRNNWEGPQLYHGYARLLPDTFYYYYWCSKRWLPLWRNELSATYRVFRAQADWTLTHTSHKDTEQSTMEASVTLDGVTLTNSLIRWSPNEWPSVCREIPVSADKMSWTSNKPAQWTLYITRGEIDNHPHVRKWNSYF
jgi:hypothetical protein